MSACALLLALASLALLVPAAGIVGQCWFLALVALTSRRRPPVSRGAPPRSYAILIPAHNEAAALPATLAACHRLDYPDACVEIHVVADNCSDATAALARAAGATVTERRDDERRGKGHALAAGLRRIDLRRHAAVLVLDADCLIDPGALRAIDRALPSGGGALQINNCVSNPDASPLTLLLAIGNRLENDFVYTPRSDLGWPLLLRGTGMVLAAETLTRVPWEAYSLTEDVEYSLALARAQIPVRFVPEVAVRSPLPLAGDALAVQRSRWARGNLGLARRRALALILEGLRRRRWRLCDLGGQLLTASRPLLLLLLLGGSLLGAAAWLAAPGSAWRLLPIGGALLLILCGAYVLLGLLRLGVTRHRLGLALRAPLALGRIVAITVAALGGRPATWQRTPRAPGGARERR
jgi:cellulose synthase/poly-beta-1,6-N-acetylglucosamine synthase-like glycosyltransferase